MNWNKNNPRFRRTRLKNTVRAKKPKTRRSRKNLLTRFGTKIGGLFRSLTGANTVPAPEKTPACRPQPAAAADPFEDLKIAVPKHRKYPGACSPRAKPKPEAEAEAHRQKAVAAVMEAISISPAPEDLAAECDDMVDPLDLAEAAHESVGPPVRPVEAASSGTYSPVKEKSANSREIDAAALAIEKEAGEKPADQPEDTAKPAEPETLPKIAALERSAVKAIASGAKRGSRDKTGQSVSGKGDQARPVKKRGPETEEPSPRKTASAESTAETDKKADEAGRKAVVPAAPPKAVSESEHIKSDGKKPTDWSRLTGRPQTPAPRKSRRTIGVILISILVGAGLGLAFIYFPGQRTPVAKVARIPAANLPKIAPLAPGFYELYAKEREAAVRSEATITPGSSLGKALEEIGIGPSHGANAIIESLREGGLTMVRPGEVAKAYWSDRNRTELSYLEYYPASGDAPLVVRPKIDGGFMRYSLATMPLTVSMAREGKVTSSLWEAGKKAGMDANVIMNITEILASEVDFLTGIQVGDSFQVLYNRDYSDGRPQGTPTIDLIKLVNKGQVLEYYRFEDSEGRVGYYDPEYRSSVKTFFVTPLQYKRISSQFSLARKHPIYKTVRPHQGVDYAAPEGTPVSSVADGTVIYCDWARGYGKLVTIKHNETYTTMYAHLSKFAPGLKKGSVVKQGDLIGNVGATGVATGPHLDFRMKKNNVFIDPIQELAKQQGKKIEKTEDQQAFATRVGQIREQMRQQLAAGPKEE